MPSVSPTLCQNKTTAQKARYLQYSLPQGKLPGQADIWAPETSGTATLAFIYLYI